MGFQSTFQPDGAKVSTLDKLDLYLWLNCIISLFERFLYPATRHSAVSPGNPAFRSIPRQPGIPQYPPPTRHSAVSPGNPAFRSIPRQPGIPQYPPATRHSAVSPGNPAFRSIPHQPVVSLSNRILRQPRHSAVSPGNPASRKSKINSQIMVIQSNQILTTSNLSQNPRSYQWGRACRRFSNWVLPVGAAGSHNSLQLRGWKAASAEWTIDPKNRPLFFWYITKF